MINVSRHIKGVALLNRLSAVEIHTIKNSNDPETLGHYEKMVINPVLDLWNEETKRGGELFRIALGETEEWKENFLRFAEYGEIYK